MKNTKLYFRIKFVNSNFIRLSSYNFIQVGKRFPEYLFTLKWKQINIVSYFWCDYFFFFGIPSRVSDLNYSSPLSTVFISSCSTLLLAHSSFLYVFLSLPCESAPSRFFSVFLFFYFFTVPTRWSSLLFCLDPTSLYDRTNLAVCFQTSSILAP